MELPTAYASKFQPAATKPRNEREELIEKFRARLNPLRTAAKIPPLSYPRIAVMLQGIPTGDLYPFYVQCDRARSFSRYFHWSLKPHAKGGK